MANIKADLNIQVKSNEKPPSILQLICLCIVLIIKKIKLQNHNHKFQEEWNYVKGKKRKEWADSKERNLLQLPWKDIDYILKLS